MPAPVGRAAKYGVNTQTLLEFLDTKITRKQIVIQSRKTKKRPSYLQRYTHTFINGVKLTDPEGKILRRWRADPSITATEGAALQVLKKHDLTLRQFRGWAAREGKVAVKWDNR